MTVYVDELMAHGWVMRGRTIKSCHMFSDQIDLGELHVIATRIGMRLSWFQNKSTPHYDLTASRRAAAIAAGAVAVGRHEAVAIWKARKQEVQRMRRYVDCIECGAVGLVACAPGCRTRGR